jgi:hypothetical protein
MPAPVACQQNNRLGDILKRQASNFHGLRDGTGRGVGSEGYGLTGKLRSDTSPASR